MRKTVEPLDAAKEMYCQLMQGITEGHYHKGDQLPTEREWAQSLGVSRPTLRGAIKSLELTGMIDSIQGSGHFISRDISHSLSKPLEMMFLLEGGTTNDILDLRMAIETMAAQKAALNADKESLDELSRILDEMGAIIKNQQTFYESPKSIPELDQRFHQKLVETSRNPLLISIMAAAESLFHSQMLGMAERIAFEDISRKIGYINMNDGISTNISVLNRIHEQHLLIFKALNNHDPVEAAASVTRHLKYVDEYQTNRCEQHYGHSGF